MDKGYYLACDFSGIQRYVLGVKTAGQAQAKRLRARSFLLELYERAALLSVQKRLGFADDDVLIQGGGGFLVRLPQGTGPEAVGDLAAELQSMMWQELRGEVQIAMARGETPLAARALLEREKRRPALAVLQAEGAWNPERMSLLAIGDPCDICGRAPGEHRVRGEDSENVLHCRNCLAARELGERLTRWNRMRPATNGSVGALGVRFAESEDAGGDSFPVGRWIPRKENGEPLTFDEIAGKAKGQRNLAVLKADVDDMGIHVGRIASGDPSYRQLQHFSRTLHTFFLDRIQRMLEQSWQSIYTIYAGGDDLLLVGPWNITLDFAGVLAKEFESGPGGEYGLTLSAGVALTPYQAPIRHAVELGEELLESAKGEVGKNRCAALGAIWTWDNHDVVVGAGKELAHWVDRRLVSRSLLHRLLRLVESDDPTRWARWVYQVQRNVSLNSNTADLRAWAGRVVDQLESGEAPVAQVAASIRYALLATRGRGDTS